MGINNNNTNKNNNNKKLILAIQQRINKRKQNQEKQNQEKQNQEKQIKNNSTKKTLLNKANTCSKKWKPNSFGFHNPAEKFKLWNPLQNTNLNNNMNKVIVIKCPLCNNKCFYPNSQHVHTYTNNASHGKLRTGVKMGIKKTFLPKIGSIRKILSCSKCSYVLQFRNSQSVRRHD